MVALDPVVPILSGVMEHFWEQVVDDAQQRCGQVSGGLPWPVAVRQHHLVEPGRSRHGALLRHQHVDDLAMLVDRSVHVPPHPGNLQVGTGALPVRPRRAGTANPQPPGKQSGESDDESLGHATTPPDPSTQQCRSSTVDVIFRGLSGSAVAKFLAGS